MDWGEVEYTQELRGVYDGWSIAVMRDGRLLNRWASDDDPTVAALGYERRFEQTQLVVDDMLAARTGADGATRRG